MVKTKNIKTVSKKLIAMFLAVLMAFSSFASVDLSAYAASFSESYLGSTSHTRIKIGGTDAFCIHYGTNSGHSGDISASTSAWEYWSNFSSSKQNKIESIIAYAYDSSAHPSNLNYKYVNNSSDYVYFGIQMAIWHITNSNITPYYFKSSDSYARSTTAINIYNDCITNGINYNYSGDDIDFEESPLYIKEENNYVGTDMVTNISTTAGASGVNLANWSVGDIELNTTAEESGADTDWLTVKWVDSDGNTPSSKSERAGVKISSSQYFKGRMGVYFESENYYYNVTKSKCYKPSAQQVIVATDISKQSCKLNVRCEITPEASIKIVKYDDDGTKIKTGVRYRVYTTKSDAVDNTLKNMVTGIWTDSNNVTHNYMETNSKGTATSDEVLEVGTTYYIRECGYYDPITDDYIEITDDDGTSNDDSIYVNNSTYRKTKAITIKSSDEGNTITVGNYGDSVDDEDRSTKKWVNIRKRGDLKITKTDEDGNAIEGITFVLTDGNTWLSGTTDKNGVLYFCNVKTGDYQLVEYPSDNYEVEYDGDTIVKPSCDNGNSFYDVSSYYGDGTIAVDVTIEWDHQTSYDDDKKNLVNNDGTGYNKSYAVSLSITNKLIKRGDLAITKLQENGSVFSGVNFTLSNDDLGISISSADNGVSTNSSGMIYFANVPVGTYKLTETIPSNNVIPDGWSSDDGGATAYTYVTIDWDQQTTYDTSTFNTVNNDGSNVESANPITITVNNRVQRGDLKIHKYVEQSNLDNNYQGGTYEDGAYFEITIYSAATDNELGVELTFTTKTDAYGDAYFCDIPIGTYTVTETKNIKTVSKKSFNKKIA